MSPKKKKKRLDWKLAGVGVLAVAAVGVGGFAMSRPDLAPKPGETFTPAPLPTFASAPTPTATAAPKPLVVKRSAAGVPLRVLFSGDSLTDGFFAKTQADSFQEIMIDKLGPVELTSAAVAHQTLSTVSKVTDVPENLDLVVIELGTNDVGIPTPLETFTAQYNDLIAKVKAKSPKAGLLCAGTWTRDGAEYDVVIDQACTNAGGRYVSFTEMYRNPLNHGPEGVDTWRGKSDTFHPNNAGHKAIAAALLKAIQVK